jgi:hypothetical protein
MRIEEAKPTTRLTSNKPKQVKSNLFMNSNVLENMSPLESPRDFKSLWICICKRLHFLLLAVQVGGMLGDYVR